MQTESQMPASQEREQILLAYVADLELEVDRLRKQTQHLHQAATDAVRDIYSQSLHKDDAVNADTILVNINDRTKLLAGLLQDLRESPGYHPAHDQVVVIAIRPMIEQVFRWQQRFLNAPYVSLRLELNTESVEWFPGRLRHILDNLVSNGLRFRDPSKGESRLTVAISESNHGYELRVSDNGVGMMSTDTADSVELFHRSAPARSAGLGVGLSVVKVLVEQSGGSVTKRTDERYGTTVLAVLPRFGVNDYLEDVQRSKINSEN